ncbi:hypothetical protein [Flavobacterium pallidum]|uniref:Uncharacterized protein n=1 Tax=Flavobacterium pallidum TaxID=2172098 RepID=A0A2S1SEX8_9FLAO|nr:hypothetical protein [Flavobacterium pallidum]AWI24922.1 hypothetical protein HYN49_02875 [Flavobacterium pallidum]
MKKLFLSLLATCLLTLTANAQTRFVKMELPSFRQSPAGPSETIIYDVSFKNKDGKTEKGQMKFVVPDEGNGLISLEFSDNMIKNTSVTTNYFVVNANKLSEESAEGKSLSDCLTDCKKNFTNPDGTKIKGRGECKAGCWWDAAVKVLPMVLSLVAAAK